jgi:hypothetical protein
LGATGAPERPWRLVILAGHHGKAVAWVSAYRCVVAVETADKKRSLSNLSADTLTLASPPVTILGAAIGVRTGSRRPLKAPLTDRHFRTLEHPPNFGDQRCPTLTPSYPCGA